MRPDIELALPARAENIAIVRHTLGGLGEVFGISEQKLSDIRLAVTEACSNAVVHAYPEGCPGMMEVSTTMVGDELSVVVRDWGQGIRPRPDSPGLGLGLSLMAALAEAVQLGHDTGEHTEVRMIFALSDEELEGNRERPGTSVRFQADGRLETRSRLEADEATVVGARPDGPITRAVDERA